MIRPVGPGSTQGPGLGQLLDEMRSAILEIQNPQAPVQMPSVLNADLPPADDWRGCYVFVTDKDCIAISTDVAGFYAWRRADGTAI